MAKRQPERTYEVDTVLQDRPHTAVVYMKVLRK